VKKTSNRRRTPAQAAIEEGWRSGLEEKIASDLTANGVEFEYEKRKIKYLWPARESTYTPDFEVLSNGIIVETKGRFVTEDRQKHLLVKQQHPDLDIRFVFSNANTRISKTSKTTYAMWCEKHDFKYASKAIPKEWLNEPPKN
jgi:hypothetical protein